MVAGCGNKCVKYLFPSFNFLFFVAGGVVLGVSLWIRFDPEIQRRIAGQQTFQNLNVQINQLFIVFYFTAAIGAVMCVLGFLGCCGACCEQICLVGTFFTLVLILVLLEIAGIVYMIVSRSTFETTVTNVFKQQFVDGYWGNPEIRNQMDIIQNTFQCCGAYSCRDYPPNGLPNTGTCQQCQMNPNVPGCMPSLFNSLNSNLTIAIIVAAVVLTIEILALIFSCVIISAIREVRNMSA